MYLLHFPCKGFGLVMLPSTRAQAALFEKASASQQKRLQLVSQRIGLRRDSIILRIQIASVMLWCMYLETMTLVHVLFRKHPFAGVSERLLVWINMFLQDCVHSGADRCSIMGTGSKCLSNNYPAIGYGTAYTVDELLKQGEQWVLPSLVFLLIHYIRLNYEYTL